MTDPGLLRETLVIEAPGDSPDGQGGLARSYVAVKSVKARIEPVSGDTRLSEDRLTQVNRLRVTLRACPGLTGANRFRKDTRVLRILSIAAADPLGRFIACLCQEETP